MNKGIQKVFSQVPGTYEILNHLLTLGFDILWRRKTATISAAYGGRRWLDVCSGTGEMADYLSRLARNQAEVFALDFSRPMVARIAQKPRMQAVQIVIADAAAMPFRPGAFDLITISFATRNLNYNGKNLHRTLQEFHRILGVGGRYVNLETSQPRPAWLRKLFHWYIGVSVRRLGQWISGSKAGYAYLAHTIPRFFTAREFADRIKSAGFQRITVKRLFWGIAAIHIAEKSADF